MRTVPAPVSPKSSPARERLLGAASEVFYAEGIHSVGVDRLISEAGVTRATFYRHFPSKEDLVLAYVQLQDASIRGQAEQAAEHFHSPRAVLGAVVDGVAGQLVGEGFRGCPFINTAAEYPDPEGPVRQAIDAHRAWFRAALIDLLTGSGHDAPEYAADLLVMLRDGAQVGGYLGDAQQARASFERAAASVIA